MKQTVEPPTLLVDGVEYPIKVENGIYFVHYNDIWMNPVQWGEALAADGKWPALLDLSKIGEAKMKGTLLLGSARETAKMLHGARTN